MHQTNVSLRKWQWVVVVLFIGWIFFSLGAYYVAHKPLDAALIQAITTKLTTSDFTFSSEALLRSVGAVLAALWILFAALGCGLWLWRWLGPTDSTQLDTLLFSFGMGLGLIGLLVLGMGLGGWLQRSFLFTLLILLTILSLPTAIPFLRALQWKRPSPLITIYLTLTIGLAFTLALLPPTSWDSLSYHLRGPWLYLQAGRIYPEIDVFSLNNPFLLEMVFMLGMSIRSDVTAQLIHFFFNFLVAGCVYTLAVNGLKLKQGWTAVLLLFAIPMVLLLAPSTYNDLALTFVILASLYAYARWHDDEQIRWLMLSGIFSGLAMSLKYTSFIAPTVIGLMLIWQNWREPKQLLRMLLAFAGMAVAVGFIWYLKSWLFMGNPVYPFVFNGRYWDDFRTLAHQDPGSGIGLNPLALLMLPYTLTLGIQDASGDAVIGPLILALLPLLLLYAFSRWGRRAPFTYWVLLIYVAAQYAFWVLGVIASAPLFQGRLMLPALAALCPLFAWIIDDLKRFDHTQFSLQRFINLVLAVVLLFGLTTQFVQWLNQNPLPYVIGNQIRSDYLTQNLGYLYQASEEMTDSLPADSVVQFLWEPRTYYCELDCRGDHILDKYGHLEHLHDSADQIAQALAAEGVTHLFIHNSGLQFLQQEEANWIVPANETEYQIFIEDHAHPVQQWGEAYSLYELKP